MVRRRSPWYWPVPCWRWTIKSLTLRSSREVRNRAVLGLERGRCRTALPKRSSSVKTARHPRPSDEDSAFQKDFGRTSRPADHAHGKGPAVSPVVPGSSPPPSPGIGVEGPPGSRGLSLGGFRAVPIPSSPVIGSKIDEPGGPEDLTFEAVRTDASCPDRGSLPGSGSAPAYHRRPGHPMQPDPRP